MLSKRLIVLVIGVSNLLPTVQEMGEGARQECVPRVVPGAGLQLALRILDVLLHELRHAQAARLQIDHPFQHREVRRLWCILSIPHSIAADLPQGFGKRWLISLQARYCGLIARRWDNEFGEFTSVGLMDMLQSSGLWRYIGTSDGHASQEEPHHNALPGVLLPMQDSQTVSHGLLLTRRRESPGLHQPARRRLHRHRQLMGMAL